MYKYISLYIYIYIYIEIYLYIYMFILCIVVYMVYCVLYIYVYIYIISIPFDIPREYPMSHFSVLGLTQHIRMCRQQMLHQVHRALSCRHVQRRQFPQTRTSVDLDTKAPDDAEDEGRVENHGKTIGKP